MKFRCQSMYLRKQKGLWTPEDRKPTEYKVFKRIYKSTIGSIIQHVGEALNRIYQNHSKTH